MKIFQFLCILGTFLIIFFYPNPLFSEGTSLIITILGDTQCIDGIDNDSDGLIDYPDDLGCSSYDDNDETDTAPSPTCGDGSCNGNEACSTCSTDCGVCPSGGGGGGGFLIAPTQAIFSGKAYPGSRVTLLKNAQKVAQIPAGPDANFKISLSGLSSGTYTFGVWAEDYKKRRSITQTFTIQITKGVTTVISGIFIPPSITTDKTEVKRGDVLNILGQSVPNAEVAVFVNSENEIVKKTTADEDGLWSYKFDTLEINYGDHLTKSRASHKEDISVFSQLVFFKVGSINKLRTFTPSTCPAKADLNGDCKVNLVDFSIAAYWYKRVISTDFAVKEKEHLSGDGKVDLVDFSIMAYYWTG